MKKRGLDQGLPRPDAQSKALGLSKYADDYKVYGMLYGAIACAKTASALIKSIDISEALKIEGVVTVLTHENLPGFNRIGLIFDDQELLVSKRIRMYGDRIALIAAKTPEAAKKAASLVKIETEQIPGIYDVENALDENAPKLHNKDNLVHEFYIKRGEIDENIINSDIVIDETYHIGGQEHAYLETQGTIAVPEADGSWKLHTTTQCPFYVRARTARFLGLPQNMVRVIQTVTGGAFGGKEDYPDEPALCAVALAKASKKPVKLIFDREYDMQVSTKRHSMVIHHRLYADKTGIIKGAKLKIMVDAGAYAGLSTVVAERANISSIGPYSVQNIEVTTQVIYTNNLFGGPYRGFGGPQVAAAHEVQIDRLAKILGMDPIEIRRLNGVSQENPDFASGEKLSQAHLYPLLLNLLEEKSNWKHHKKAIVSQNKSSTKYKEGIGIGTIIYGVNLHWGGQRLDRGGAYLIIMEDGSISLSVGITDMGQGAMATMRIICARALGVPEEYIRLSEVDTALIPDSGPTVASRATHSGGRAVLDAVKILNSRLKPIAAKMIGVDSENNITCKMGIYSSSESEKTITFKEVIAELYASRINPAAIGWYRSEKRNYDPETGQGRAYAFYVFGGHIVRVKVDVETGLVTVLEVTAVHDVGQIINLQGIEGQVHGGIVQGLGWALTENLKLSEGKLLNAGFTDYLIPTSSDIPFKINMEFIEEPEAQGPLGAKGIGEPSFISVGAATLNAVSDAIGKEINKLPLIPENTFNFIKDN